MDSAEEEGGGGLQTQYDRQGLDMVTRTDELLADLKIRFHLLVFRLSVTSLLHFRVT